MLVRKSPLQFDRKFSYQKIVKYWEKIDSNGRIKIFLLPKSKQQWLINLANINTLNIDIS